VCLKRKFVELSTSYFAPGQPWLREVCLPASCDTTSIQKHNMSNGNVCYIFKKKAMEPPKKIVIDVG
jgi:hypothetical protein